jgi:hypothetical protein
VIDAELQAGHVAGVLSVGVDSVARERGSRRKSYEPIGPSLDVMICFGEGWGPEWPQGSGKRSTESISHMCGVPGCGMILNIGSPPRSAVSRRIEPFLTRSSLSP